MSDDAKRTDSGIEIAPLYSAGTLGSFDAAAKLGEPGKPPYTRGVYPTMYRG
jgi:methylmalonyl-CoA mutase N-terminal domain/subunit